MKIKIFSTIKNEYILGGENIYFEQTEESILQKYNLNDSSKVFYQLSFSYTFNFDNDEVFFSFGYTYTYTNLLNDLLIIENDPCKSKYYN